jgi:hypothetical protein
MGLSANSKNEVMTASPNTAMSKTPGDENNELEKVR